MEKVYHSLQRSEEYKIETKYLLITNIHTTLAPIVIEGGGTLAHGVLAHCIVIQALTRVATLGSKVPSWHYNIRMTMKETKHIIKKHLAKIL